MTIFKEYTTEPEVIEAVLVTPGNVNEVAVWCGGEVTWNVKPSDHTDESISMVVPRVGGQFYVYNGEYLVRNKKTGRFSRLTAKEFEEKGYKEKVKSVTGFRSGGVVSKDPGPVAINQGHEITGEYGQFMRGSGEAYGQYADSRYWQDQDGLRDVLK